MYCRKVRNLIPFYFDDQLPVEQREIVEKHIKECRSCAIELYTFKGIIKLLRSKSEQDGISPPIECIQELHRKLVNIVSEQYKTKEEIWLLPLIKIRPVLRVVAILIFVIIGILVISNVFIYRHKYNQPIQQLQQQEQVHEILSASATNRLGLNQDAIFQFYVYPREKLDFVNFKVHFPKGVCFVSNNQPQCSRKVISWKGPLDAGENIILLRVRGVEKGKWKIKVSLEKENKVKHIVIPIEINGTET